VVSPGSKREKLRLSKCSPLHPQEQTLLAMIGWSELGHLRTWHGKANSLAHEDKTPLLRVAPWVACASCGLERIG
jgi:hypothetical protein